MVQVETKDMLQRLFNNSLADMANYLLKPESISLEEMAEIKRLLNAIEKKKKGGTKRLAS